MPVIGPYVDEAPDDLMIEDLMYNPPFVAAKELIPDITPERFDDFVTSAILGIDTSQVEQPDVGWQPPMESQVKQALTDYGRGEDAGELQAIAEMTYVDPVSNDEEMFFEKYLDPARQAAIDITSQVESFADMPEPEGPTAADRKADRAAAKQAAADKRDSDRAIAKAAKASRKAEVKREAATKKKAQEQRDKLDSASKKALQDHMAWMATQTKRVAKEEKKRAKRYAGGRGGALMYT